MITWAASAFLVHFTDTYLRHIQAILNSAIYFVYIQITSKVYPCQSHVILLIIDRNNVNFQ